MTIFCSVRPKIVVILFQVLSYVDHRFTVFEGRKGYKYLKVDTINGKYKIGQEWSDSFRRDIAYKIIQREGITRAREILKDLKIIILKNGELELPISVNLQL